MWRSSLPPGVASYIFLGVTTRRNWTSSCRKNQIVGVKSIRYRARTYAPASQRITKRTNWHIASAGLKDFGEKTAKNPWRSRRILHLANSSIEWREAAASLHSIVIPVHGKAWNQDKKWWTWENNKTEHQNCQSILYSAIGIITKFCSFWIYIKN